MSASIPLNYHSPVNRWGMMRFLLTLLASAVGWSIVAAACMCVGSTTNRFHWPAKEMVHDRAEVVLLASLIGAALSSAGVVYQAILRNPLADPYLLGVSSGAMEMLAVRVSPVGSARRNL